MTGMPGEGRAGGSAQWVVRCLQAVRSLPDPLVHYLSFFVSWYARIPILPLSVIPLAVVLGASSSTTGGAIPIDTALDRGTAIPVDIRFESRRWHAENARIESGPARLAHRRGNAHRVVKVSCRNSPRSERHWKTSRWYRQCRVPCLHRRGRSQPRCRATRLPNSQPRRRRSCRCNTPGSAHVFESWAGDITRTMHR